MFDIITFGSASEDIVVKPKNLTVLKYEKDSVENDGVCFPLGSKIDVEQIMFNTGGGGTNTAATFALQGFKTAFYGKIGKDNAGQEIIKELKNLKVNTGFVFTTNAKPTNHSIVILSNTNDRTILAYRGAAELLDKKEILWNKLKTKWIYLAPLSGLLCLPRSESADSTTGATTPFEDIVNFAKENKIKLAVNPGIAQLSLPNFSEIVKKIDILFLNQEEASFLTKMPITNENEIFKKLDQMCSGILVMTKGGEGVVVSDGKYIYSAKPPQNRGVVDTTGAGDSFGSGFIAEFMRPFDSHSADSGQAAQGESARIEKSIQLGMANSVGCISQIGAKNGLLKKGQEFERVLVTKEECDNNLCLVK